jgi:1-acyl-sn-glycerol-3-phosphate acyltransferase
MCLESVAVVVFPEGTRSTNGHLREKISTGMIKAAHGAGLKIIPVALDGTDAVFPKEMDRVTLDQEVRVTIGAPLDPADYADEDAWVRATWGQVKRMHDELKRAA